MRPESKGKQYEHEPHAACCAMSNKVLKSKGSYEGEPELTSGIEIRKLVEMTDN